MGTLREHPCTFTISGCFLLKMRNVSDSFNRCTVHSDIYTAHSPTDANLLKL